MALLELDNIVQRYGSSTVVDGVSFSVDTGGIACLLGPSGCGKTTVLRCIAGFEGLAGGEIRVRGRAVSRVGRRVPPEKRRIGMVFQDYALFPHLSVAANIGFGLTALTGDERRRRVGDLLETVGLAALGSRYPHELSGGQQQRVALARALAPRPQLILLDEPFSNLDVDLRERLSLEVREILKRQNTTAVLVTHDQHEAFAIADEIGVMTDGIVQQWDTPYRIYHQPANRRVANFVGQGVFLPGVALGDGRIEIEFGIVGARVPPQCRQGCAICDRGCGVEVLLRPDDIVHDDQSALRAEVRHKAFRGAEILYTLRLASGRDVLALVPSHYDHAVGEDVGIRLDVEHVVAFDNSERPAFPSSTRMRRSWQ
ncbi:MAG TPA: ABC transporter ATP-binding protein [Accumulibacter sp.]|jgi:iron(III) transport system ATP-binding protein|nr:ABC transporter ATP-binding protein [Accumulibacter sp.]HQC79964.1 ABC transporter ATP-binding protein [Accumulibacter sp.]